MDLSSEGPSVHGLLLFHKPGNILIITASSQQNTMSDPDGMGGCLNTCSLPHLEQRLRGGIILWERVAEISLAFDHQLQRASLHLRNVMYETYESCLT